VSLSLCVARQVYTDITAYQDCMFSFTTVRNQETEPNLEELLAYRVLLRVVQMMQKEESSRYPRPSDWVILTKITCNYFIFQKNLGRKLLGRK